MYNTTFKAQWTQAFISVVVVLAILLAWFHLYSRYEKSQPAAQKSAVKTDYPKEWTDPVTGMQFVLVAAGKFMMGSPEGEVGREPQERLHQVTLTRPFYLGKYEVSQSQWAKVMGSNPSRFQERVLETPVEQVSWLDVQQFVARLNKLSRTTVFRLPTEAEWEYACRAGSTMPYNTGSKIRDDQANFDARYPVPGSPPGNYVGRPTEGGAYPPNAWGLYDMHGNVWEWCQDDYCNYPDGPVVDPLANCGSSLKVIRGGSWYFDASSARCATRYTHHRKDFGFSIGFRVVRGL